MDVYAIVVYSNKGYIVTYSRKNLLYRFSFPEVKITYVVMPMAYLFFTNNRKFANSIK